MQQAAPAIEEAACGQAQVDVGAFQGAVTIVEQPADLELRTAAAAQGAQLAGLVVEAGGLDRQGAVAFDDAQAVVQRAAEVEVEALAGELAAAVVEVATTDLDQALGVQAAIAVVEGTGADQRVATLRGHSATIVVETGQCLEVQALGLDHAALAVAGQAVAVAQHTAQVGTEGALQAGQYTTTVVHVAGGQGQVTGLGENAAILVIDIAGGQGQPALALQGALGVGEACGLHVEGAVLAVDQAVVVVAQGTIEFQGYRLVGCHGASVAVVKAARQHAQQALTGDLAALVGNLRGPLNAQRASAGQLAVGIGQRAQ
ncbi:hypothetical protein D3C77_138900 [compost metagenome]